MLYLVVALLVAIDQITKMLVITRIDLHQVVSIIDGFFSITYVKNNGGAFSFLSGTSWGIILLTGLSLIVSIITLILISYFKQDYYRWVRIALTVLAGGAIGNMIDRIWSGAVVDFLMFDFGSYTFPIFNFADMCIVVSCISLILILFFDRKLIDAMSQEKPKTDNTKLVSDEQEEKESQSE